MKLTNNQWNRIQDKVAGKAMVAMTIATSALVLIIGVTLYLRAKPILGGLSIGDLLFGSTWQPSQGQFGFAPFIIGTLLVTLLAMLIAVPISLLSAIYLAEYAHDKLRTRIYPVIDLLAGIPPVVFGVWGVVAVVPLVARVAPIVSRLHIPFLTTSSYTTGFSLLAGGVVLAIMVSPLIISITDQVLRVIPMDIREASLSVGATRWQTVKHALIRPALPGITAAIILGFSRAFGETMAVLMVVGNVAQIPHSIFDPAYPLPALIANNYGEMMSIPQYDSALLFGALLLMLVILFFTLAARLILLRVQRGLHA